MNFKKTVIKSLAFAAALGFIGLVSPLTAKATAEFTFDGVNEKADTKVYKFWGLAKEVTDEKKADFTDTKFYKVDEVEAIVGDMIDLSFLSKHKENIIAVGKKEDFKTGEWKAVAIPAQNKSFKAAFVISEDGTNVKVGDVTIPLTNTYNGKTYGALAMVNEGVEYPLNEATKANAVEVSSGKTGNWTSLNVFFGGTDAAAPAGKNLGEAFQRLMQGGADLHIRLKGVKKTTSLQGAWPSKEVKVKFAKQPKAPKLVVDTQKGEIKFKKGQEYKIEIEGASDPATFNKVEGRPKKTFTELGITGEKNVTITLKDSATPKKIASKETVVKLSKQEAQTVAALTTTGDLVTGALKFELKLPYDISKGAMIINSKKEDYEYAITPNGAVPAADHKWVKIRGGKENKKKPGEIIPSKTSVKYSKEAGKFNVLTADNSSAKIYVRLAGTKQDKKDGSAKLASQVGADKGVNTFKIANEARTINLAFDEIAGKPKTQIITTKEVSLDHVFKSGKPKIKVTQPVPGVSVKASKIDKTSKKGTVSVKVSKSAFKTVPSTAPVFKFKVSFEGAEKEVEVNFNISE